MNDLPSYEQLGLFYLGKQRTPDSDSERGAPLLFRSKHLTTHGVIIGMTGSGKTGLGIALIEEAIMDDIPVIVIDPKGDMANLLLSFPDLSAADFKPWVDEAEAARKELSVEQLAAQTAAQWRDGLAAWGQGAARLARFTRKSAITVYTPGSTTGVPVSVVSGFAAPDDATMADGDAINALVGGQVSGLLHLIGVNSDPLTGREHILVSSIVLHYWRRGEDVSLERLIGAIADPPFDRVGVFGMARFYPQNERMKLAMALNNLIAGPSFAPWLAGEPLDPQHLLYGSDGKPRTAIFSIAHLSEEQRMFFVTLLLNRMIGWMRRQPGTSSLRALLYMDEIFGYFPPVGNPPSKQPMLLLLKQARAYGVGVALATQNPVDLDYKGLANIGSWFIGRLQTSQDRDKVLDGLTGAGMVRAEAATMLADMKGRHFLLNSAHLDTPLIFETRWVMSYLKGPISLTEIGALMQGHGSPEPPPEAADFSGGPAAATSPILDHPPVLNEAIEQRFRFSPAPPEEMVFAPWLVGRASVRFFKERAAIDEIKEVELRLYLDEASSDFNWREAQASDVLATAQPGSAPSGARFYALPAQLSTLRSLSSVAKAFADYIYQHERLELWYAPALKIEGKPGESEAAFRVRISEVLREEKEAEAEKLLSRFARRLQTMEKRRETGFARVDKERQDVSLKTTDTLISFGSAVLGAFLGRKTISSATMTRTAGGLRKAGQLSREKADVRRAEEQLARVEDEISDLLVEQDQAIAELGRRFDPATVAVETTSVKPRRRDIFDLTMCLVWDMVHTGKETERNWIAEDV
jgi:hypothetical protein